MSASVYVSIWHPYFISYVLFLFHILILFPFAILAKERIIYFYLQTNLLDGSDTIGIS